MTLISTEASKADLRSGACEPSKILPFYFLPLELKAAQLHEGIGWARTIDFADVVEARGSSRGVLC